MFYSGDFMYDGICSFEYDIYLVSESNDLLNEYGINFTDKDEITLTFCYATELGEALVWHEDILKFVHEWFISDDYKFFTSDDEEEDYYYLLKGVNLVKRFTPELKGLIDVTFKVYKNYAYKKQYIDITQMNTDYRIYNFSNVEDFNKPILEITNIKSENIIIENKTLNESLILNNLQIGTNVTVDNQIGIIKDSNDRNLLKYSNRNWLKLKQGSNKICVNGDCVIKLKCLYPVYK